MTAFNPQPKNHQISNPKYLAWVKTLLCCGCQSPADDAHHGIGYGWGGAALTADDYLAMPMCRGCHTELHNDPKKWENKKINGIAINAPQPIYIWACLYKARKYNIIGVKIYRKYRNICDKALECRNETM